LSTTGALARGAKRGSQSVSVSLIYFPPASHAGFDRFVEGPAAFGPVLEGPEVVDLAVAHLLEHLARQRRAPTRRTVQDEHLVLGEVLVVVRGFWIGAKLQHATRDVDGSADLAALFHLGSIAYVDNERVPLRHHLPGLRRRDPRHRRIGGLQHLLAGCGHVILLSLLLSDGH